MNYRELLGRTVALLAKSRQAAELARLVRNQAEAVIGYHLNDDHPHHRGEMLVAATVAPHTRRFVDVGANVGGWTQMVLDVAPSAEGLLVEPGHNAVAALQAVFKGRTGIEILKAAASDEPGTLTFFEDPGAGEGSSLLASAARTDASPHTVPVICLDDVLDQRNWDTVDFVKIDAEGYDARVIAGLSGRIESGRIGVIQFEYNAQWAQAGSTLWPVLDHFSNCKYKMWLVRSDGLYPFDYNKWGEFYRHANFLAVHPQWLSYTDKITKAYI